MRTVLVTISLFVFASSVWAQRTDFADIDFRQADSLALACKDEQLTNIPALTNKLTKGLTTDAERFRAAYRWICNNISNNYTLYSRNMGKRRKYQNDSVKLEAWNSKFQQLSMQKLIKRKSTICTGYAYLLQQFAEELGIPCEIVNGYARTSTIDVKQLTAPNHSWNAVFLRGKWYLCDPTWAAGIPDPETNLFTFDYNDGFFLANPELFVFNHYPEDPKWLLLDAKQHTFTQFLEAPVFYGGTYSELNSYQQPKKMHYQLHKNESLTYELETLASVNTKKVKLYIDNGHNIVTRTPSQIAINQHQLSIRYAFAHKGFYDVHLYIEDQLISTHTVKVTD